MKKTSFTVDRATPLFLNGTAVGAYEELDNPPGWHGAPRGKRVARATAPDVTFTGLRSGTGYVAIGEVDGEWRRVYFTTP